MCFQVKKLNLDSFNKAPPLDPGQYFLENIFLTPAEREGGNIYGLAIFQVVTSHYLFALCCYAHFMLLFHPPYFLWFDSMLELC